MDNIRVGCAVVAREGDRIVLGRRGKQPFYGKWVIPGGGIELFERFSDTAKREFREETGLEISVGRILKVEEIIVAPTEHRIVIFVDARVVGGDRRASSDLLEVEAFSRDHVKLMAGREEFTPTVQRVLIDLGWLAPVGLPSYGRHRRAIKSPNGVDKQRRSLIGEAKRALTRGRRDRFVSDDQLRLSGI